MPADLTRSLQIDPATLPDEALIFGHSAAMRAIRDQIEHVALMGPPVLIQGESGTGKEVIARYIHIRSNRREEPFVKVNCATVPASLLESELFGYQKGAFSGAKEDRAGLIELASGGTLFLDQIGELDSAIQGKVLRLLQSGFFARIGGVCERNGQVRVICAMSIDLRSAIGDGVFGEDLFRRLQGVSMHLVALRNRKGDIPQLCDYFLQKFARQFGRSAPRLDAQTMRLLLEWDWPGNFRELENWIARAVILGDAAVLAAELRCKLGTKAPEDRQQHGLGALKESAWPPASAATTAIILRALRANSWNRRKTAEDLNMSYRSFLYKLREAGLPHRRRSHRGYPPAAH